MTILLAEDEDDVRDLIATFLRSRGYELLVAANGAEALDLARTYEGAIDLLLTDVVMPVVSGVDVARRLQRERPCMEIVFMSGYMPEPAEIRASAFPASTFLAKPFTLQSLGATLRAFSSSRV